MITEACRAQRSRSAAITTPGVAASGCRRRRPISVALRWLVVLGLAGCGGGDPVEATATEAPAESAAAVAQGSASDSVGTEARAAAVKAPASSADSSVVIRRQLATIKQDICLRIKSCGTASNRINIVGQILGREHHVPQLQTPR